MKALCGGLLTNIPAAFAFFGQFANVVPIWGIQHLRELEEFLSFEERAPALDGDLQRAIAKDRAELAGSFCRGCAYCLGADLELTEKYRGIGRSTAWPVTKYPAA